LLKFTQLHHSRHSDFRFDFCFDFCFTSSPRFQTDMARPSISLKARALRYLSMREHSRLELTRKLARYAEEGDDIEALLDTLEAANFQSQSRFAESLVHRRAHRFGNSRIAMELQSHGLDAATLAAAKANLGKDEAGRACEVWRKKFSHPPRDAAERGKQMRFLQQRGFSHLAIQGAMRAAGRNVDDDGDADGAEDDAG
jgi:regulatory protein